MDSLLIENFSRMMSKLLSEENKDKLLGEISEELEQYISQIKNMVDSGSITYDQLREEISKNINIRQDQQPGSVAQMLLGCIDEESCPMRQEEILDIPFFYDKKNNQVIPITQVNTSISPQSSAVIYVTGSPSDVSMDTIKQLQENGFSKIKIMYKSSSRSKYRTFNINNVQLYTNPTRMFNSKTAFLVAFLVMIILYMYLKK
jgi:hypothetical protein